MAGKCIAAALRTAWPAPASQSHLRLAEVDFALARLRYGAMLDRGAGA